MNVFKIRKGEWSVIDDAPKEWVGRIVIDAYGKYRFESSVDEV